MAQIEAVRVVQDAAYAELKNEVYPFILPFDQPLVILFSIIGGLSFFGPEGFILGPLTISLFIALFDIYQLMVKTEEKVIQEEMK